MAGIVDFLTGVSARRMQKSSTHETLDQSCGRFLSPGPERKMTSYGLNLSQPKSSYSDITGSLRDYQLKGLQWLENLHTSHLNGILADEMGLGKTVQVIAFLLSLQQNHGLIGPHLLVMPLSVISSWKGDIAKFGAQNFDLFVHHGDRDSREDGFYAWYRCLKSSRRDRRKIALFVTTYELALKDEHLLARLGKRNATVGWEYLIVDEAHRLKNKNSLLFEALNRVHDTGRRLLLTGTPLQNNLSELWALLHFILPGIFRSEEEFNELFSAHLDVDSEDDEVGDTRFARKQASHSKLFRMMNMHSVLDLHRRAPLSHTEYRSAVLAQLHDLLKPYILRRVKSDVALELPPKVEKVVYCPLSGLQREIYRIFRSRVEAQREDMYKYDSFVELRETGGPHKKSLGTANNLLMQLRKLCNHPFLVLEDIQTIPDDLYYERLIKASGKLFVLDKLLTKLLAQGSKVLIFSQMTAMLDILQGYLQGRGVSCARLDGNTSHDARESQLREFNTPQGAASSPRNLNVGDFEQLETAFDSPHNPGEGRPLAQEASNHSVFLLSTRAGGVGINLQAADTVILFDSDWNPQADLQAISRAHRIGQTRPVLVLRLVSTGPDEQTYSVEQRILRRAAKKLNAERQVLANGLFDLSDQAPDASFVTPEAGSRVAANCITPDRSQESLLALFETITDTESVTTDSSSPVPVGFTSEKSPFSPSVVEISPKKISTKPFSVVRRLVDMYRLDFTPTGVEQICARAGDSTLEYSAQALSSNDDDGDLAQLMTFTDKALWKEWLGNESMESEECEQRAGQNAAQDHCMKQPINNSARKRGFAQKSIWKKIHGDGSDEESSSVDEEVSYRSGRKARRALPFSGATRRRPRDRSSSARSRCTEDVGSEAEEEKEDGEFVQQQQQQSPRGRTSRGTPDVVPREVEGSFCRTAAAEVSLREDDICALCGQAWVTQQEVATYLNLRAQELQQRTPVVTPVASPKPVQKACTAPSRTGSSSKRGASRAHNSTDSLLGLVSGSAVKANVTAPPPCVRTAPTHSPQQAPAVSSAEMVNMMILCDGCDGSYHMICIGLDQVPDEDWFCRLCQ